MVMHLKLAVVVVVVEVVSSDRMQRGLYRSRFPHRDRLSSVNLVNKMFIIWQTRTIEFV